LVPEARIGLIGLILTPSPITANRQPLAGNGAALRSKLALTMRVLLCKFCEYVCKLENGRHNLVGIFDDIRTNVFPVDHPAFFLTFQLEFDREDMGAPLEIVAKFVAPDNSEILRSDLKGEVPTSNEIEHVRMFFFTPIQPLRLQKAGNYRIVVTNQGDIIHIENLPVYQVLPAVPAAP
jgi:hypothetical protein